MDRSRGRPGAASRRPAPRPRGPWLIDPRVTFLNHGSFGACPRPVLAEQARLRRRLEREPVRFFTRELPGLLEAARARVAACVGAAPAELVPVRNATYAVGSVLGSWELAPGDEVLTTDHVYNACRNALEHVTARAGAALRVARVPFPLTRPGQVVEAVLGAVTGRTRYALLDHVTSPTGLRFPIEELVPALRSRGVETLVDGAHGPGMVPLALTRLGAAWYTGNLHKWVCAPKGAGFLWIRPDQAERTYPAVISHGLNVRRPGRSLAQDLFDWTGTDDPTPFLCVPAALDFLEGLRGGLAAHREANRALVLRGRDLLCERLGLAPPAPDPMLGSMAALVLPPQGPDEAAADPAAFPNLGLPLYQALVDRFRIQVPVSAWPAPPARVLRISAQAYNRIEDYAALAEALATLVPALGRGARPPA